MHKNLFAQNAAVIVFLSLFGKLRRCLRRRIGILKGVLALKRMGGGFSRRNWCGSSSLNDSLLLSVRTERRENDFTHFLCGKKVAKNHLRGNLFGAVPS